MNSGPHNSRNLMDRPPACGCIARSKSTGQQCLRPAILGGNVCLPPRRQRAADKSQGSHAFRAGPQMCGGSSFYSLHSTATLRTTSRS
jgi:hypothetical protein